MCDDLVQTKLCTIEPPDQKAIKFRPLHCFTPGNSRTGTSPALQQREPTRAKDNTITTSTTTWFTALPANIAAYMWARPKPYWEKNAQPMPGTFARTKHMEHFNSPRHQDLQDVEIHIYQFIKGNPRPQTRAASKMNGCGNINSTNLSKYSWENSHYKTQPHNDIFHRSGVHRSFSSHNSKTHYFLKDQSIVHFSLIVSMSTCHVKLFLHGITLWKWWQ